MGHRRDGNGQVGGDYSSPGDPGNPVPDDHDDTGDDTPDDED
ncbi:hypothetical protein AB0G73_02445 [Streptomyces sp. NPDC020719]